ncbi:dihydrofolate reductase family protein [Geodermatophilus sp. DSM 44513]|uniref:dihydrofolate reductase family protein n=1 Tax=Geodermatophilus sp. DSM 44513 TaxID=1528104 RepID=UPI00127D13A8|nr:dihydrofolate reductase family protein [Geodermatophilus sp. DSM 44513]WNV73943.1 dihydrofolate reductase family protein [Geodermatophilus sp. DSM 44513]
MRRLLPGVGGEGTADLDDTGLVEAYRLPPGRSLRVDFVTALDGSVTVGGRSGGLGSPGDRRVFRTLRALADVVLVGHGTAAAEGYRPVDADPSVAGLRTVLDRPASAPVAVVSRRASLAPDGRLAVPSTLLVTCAAADPDRRAALAAAGVGVLVCGDDDVDLPAALDALAERGLEQVLCEGGPALLSAALAAGVVDELDLTLAPALVGSPDRLLAGALADVVRPRLVQLLEEDGVLFTRYAVDR